MESDSSEEQSSTDQQKMATTRKAPRMIDMIADAVRGCTDRKGATPAYIRKFILGKYNVVDGARFKTTFRKAFLTGIEKNVLIRTKVTKDAEGLSGRVKLVAKAKPREKASVPASSAPGRSSNPGPSSSGAPSKTKKSGSVIPGDRAKDTEPRKPAVVQKRRAEVDTKNTVADTAGKTGTAARKPVSSRVAPKRGKGSGFAAKTGKGSDVAAKADKGSDVAAKARKGKAAAAKPEKVNGAAAKGEKSGVSDDEETIVDVENCSESEGSAAERQSESEDSAAEGQSNDDTEDEEAARKSENEDSAEETMQRSEEEKSDTEAEEAISTIHLTETKRGPGKKNASKKPSQVKKIAGSEDTSGAGDHDDLASSALANFNISDPAETAGPTGDALEPEVEPKAKKQRPKPGRRGRVEQL